MAIPLCLGRGKYVDLSLIVKMSAVGGSVRMWAGTNIELVNEPVRDQAVAEAIVTNLMQLKCNPNRWAPSDGPVDWGKVNQDAEEYCDEQTG